jgi:hypothetical protein
VCVSLYLESDYETLDISHLLSIQSNDIFQNKKIKGKPKYLTQKIKSKFFQ